MNVGDVYLDIRYTQSEQDACDHFFIQLSEPDPETGEAVFCQTSRVNPNRTFTTGCQGDSYNLPPSAKKLPFGATIYMDDDWILLTEYQNIIHSTEVQYVFSLLEYLPTLIECIKKSRNIIGKKKNML